MRPIAFALLTFAYTTLASKLAEVEQRWASPRLNGRGNRDCFDAVTDHRTITTDFPSLPTAIPETITGIEVSDLIITNPCELPEATGWVGDVIASFSSNMQLWKDVHATELRSIASACSDVEVFNIATNAVTHFVRLCSTVLQMDSPHSTITTANTTPTGLSDPVSNSSPNTPSPDTATTATTTATGSSDAVGTGSQNVAVRETGAVLAAAAAAGMMIIAI
ncbi:hypothetical protein CSAL01_11809 [Colletotrichum salicis]|uniref:Infection structure specific protein n=1 Tax=Colletotrichum salicis TaxID=1209931 RepID=A0A135V0U4_9PEZI|nr:hypothetical protein CSAL01_11809 [Colletotrichum salicis]